MKPQSNSERKAGVVGMTETDKLLARIGTARDAISRKTEQTSLDYMIDGVLMNCSVLLKEQEAVKPITEHHLFLCPVCKNTLFREQKFCHECGKRIEWGGR